MSQGLLQECKIAISGFKDRTFKLKSLFRVLLSSIDSLKFFCLVIWHFWKCQARYFILSHILDLSFLQIKQRLKALDKHNTWVIFCICHTIYIISVCSIFGDTKFTHSCISASTIVKLHFLQCKLLVEGYSEILKPSCFPANYHPMVFNIHYWASSE